MPRNSAYLPSGAKTKTKCITAQGVNNINNNVHTKQRHLFSAAAALDFYTFECWNITPCPTRRLCLRLSSGDSNCRRATRLKTVGHRRHAAFPVQLFLPDSARAGLLIVTPSFALPIYSCCFCSWTKKRKKLCLVSSFEAKRGMPKCYTCVWWSVFTMP